MLSVSVLGELSLEADGRPLDQIASRRARSLLGWLAVHPGMHPRARVASVFWPEVLDDSARSSLRTSLATLKRELGPEAADVVTATRERVGIEPGQEVEIDLDGFARLVSRGELQEAAALCHGDLLADLDDDWVNEPREHHRRDLMDVLGRIAADADDAGDLDAALDRSREQIALDPLAEEAQHKLIERLAAAGDRAGALAAYKAYDARLRRDLGIAPSASIRELATNVRSGSMQAAGNGSGPGTSKPTTPEVHYARNGSVYVAYQSFGEGELEFVLVPGLVSNLEFAWEHPAYRRFMDRLASFARVTVYDKRGMGLSDPLDTAAGFDQHLDDLAAVIDAAELNRPVVMGCCDGGAVAALYAAHHPDAVESLVLYAAFPKLNKAPGYPEGGAPEALEAVIQSVSEAWGSGVTASVFAAELFDDEEFCRWWGRYERASASPGLVISALRLDGELDMRDVLPAIHVPTLQLHRTGDPAASVEGGRFMSERIPDARMVEFPGTLHWPWLGDTDALIDEIEQFLIGRPPPAHEPDRALATVMSADFVDATKTAARLDDQRWQNLLEDVRDTTAGREIKAHQGQLIKGPGNGLLATFDRPASAIRCAQSLRQSLSLQGIEIRAGLHTGEIELRGEDVAGMALQIAARVGSHAKAGETLASRTVRDLVVGSGIEFEDHGAVQLKGVPGEWDLLSVKA
jgi:DNA-binding SARP family transcriptional activator/pimeloyl-ACP methyl ester carboxylesterase/class 3 adenylate cyclase